LTSGRRGVVAGVVLLTLLAFGAWADRQWGWVEPAFDAVAHLFYEVPVLARLRGPSQLALVRMHLVIASILTAAACFASPGLGRHGRWCCAVFVVGYVIRATVWIAGGNLPLVPGDSCHYLEVASSVARGEGPVKHYVESFFRDYPAIRERRGVLDDWATPLYAYVLAGSFKLARVDLAGDIESLVAVAKGTSFLLNLFAFPALYVLALRRFGRDVALGAIALLAVLPVHAIYAGFALRESLVALTSVLAVWTFTEMANARTRSAVWGWTVVAGIAAGLAVLARNTALALVAAAGLYGLVAHGRRLVGPLLAWGLVVAAVIAPWAWATWREYAQPFYTYTNYFQYNFSWTVHHYEKGNTLPSEFYTYANAPTIFRVKLKSFLIIAVYSTMIVSLPLMWAFWRRLRRPGEAPPPARGFDRLIAWIVIVFIASTLANIADVTQVAQLGRYYLPLFVLMLPTAVAGVRDWLECASPPNRIRSVLAISLVALLWADPTWAYDAGWLVKPYQMHWPALRAAGDWIKQHPDAVPPDARVMTWFPWEMRVASQRTTVLLPRNYAQPRIETVIRQYGVTHVLWGSFEPPPHVDPEAWAAYLERLRLGLGLTDARELFRSPPSLPYPVRLYRVR